MAERATIVDLGDDHLDDAASLLADRHRRQRLFEPGLDPTYEDPAAARAEIETVRAREGASGVAALAGGRVAGFLVGAPLEDNWGPNVWVPAAGHAVAEPELIRDLYASAAERRVADGRTSHYAIVPATDGVLAWSREAGYSTVVTDWRMTNLTSSRTWPRLGFRPTFYRLFRGIT